MLLRTLRAQGQEFRNLLFYHGKTYGMRYFIVRYLRKSSGQMDELVTVSKKVKASDSASAAVILDFKMRKVEKAHLDGTTLPRDFDRIRGFYAKHYPNIIQDLEAIHQPPAASATDKDPI